MTTATATAGVPLRCAPGRAARAVGNDTTVANGAEPPPQRSTIRLCSFAPRSRPCGRASLTQRRPVRRHRAGPSPPGPLSRTPPLSTLGWLPRTGEGETPVRAFGPVRVRKPCPRRRPARAGESSLHRNRTGPSPNCHSDGAHDGTHPCRSSARDRGICSALARAPRPGPIPPRDLSAPCRGRHPKPPSPLMPSQVPLSFPRSLWGRVGEGGARPCTEVLPVRTVDVSSSPASREGRSRKHAPRRTESCISRPESVCIPCFGFCAGVTYPSVATIPIRHRRDPLPPS
jgi:hypothetical protein